MSLFTATFRRDFFPALRRPGQVMGAPVFFVLAATLFPLALGPDPDFLMRAAPGLLMIAALFAALLPLERLFHDDVRDGTLDLLRLSGGPVSLYVAGRLCAHWCLTGAPLVMLSPLMILMLGLPVSMMAPCAAVLLPVTLLLTLIGAPGAALTLGTRQGGVLLALLLLPLYIPVLIFGAGALSLAQPGAVITAPLLFLWALLALAVPLVPLATAAIVEELE